MATVKIAYTNPATGVAVEVESISADDALDRFRQLVEGLKLDKEE